MSTTTIVLFVLATALALSGFAIAEVVRLQFGPAVARLAKRLDLFPGWDKRQPLKPHFKFAWWVGGLLYSINLINVLFQMFTGTSIPSPMSGMDLLPAVVIYPLMCVAVWPMLLSAHDAFMPKSR